MPESEGEREQGDRNVDEEDRAPRQCIHQPASEYRPGSRGEGGKPGPGANRLASFIGRKGRTDDGEATWDEKRPTNALHRTRRNQGADIWCQSTTDGSGRKDGDTE